MRALQSPPGPPGTAGGPVAGTRAALPASVVLGRIVPDHGRRAWAHVIDASLALVAGIVVAVLLWALGSPAWATVPVTLAVLVLAAAALVAQLSRTGQTPGLRWLQLRTVRRADALPFRPGRSAGGVVVADLRAGRDPLRLQPTVGAPTAAVAETGRWHDLGESRRHVARLTIDDGTTFTVTGPTVLGRDPVPPAGSSWEVQAVPDLTRTISKNHVLLEPDVDGVWVTDLGSRNGTTVLTRDGGRQTVARGARARAPLGGRIAVGSRLVLVSTGTEDAA